MSTESKSITTESITSNTSTKSVRGKKVDVSVTGAFDATWTVERQVGASGQWGEVHSYDGPQQKVIQNASVCQIRITVSGYTSGAVNITLQGDR